MKMSIFMMTAMLTISGFVQPVYSASTLASESRLHDYETRWCRDAGFILRNSLEAAYNAETFEQEVLILKRAINNTLSTLNPKFSYYLESTLFLAIKLEALVSTPKDKVLVLRRNIENALEDLSYLDNRFGNRYDQDHSVYVRAVLVRIVDEAYRSKTDKIENTILNSGASSAVQILSESDNRRDPRNACATRYLKEVIQMDDVHYKRSLVSEAISSLNYGCRY